MVQTMSSFFYYVFIQLIYLPLIQPFTANAPIRRFDAIIECSKLEFIKPLVITVDNFLYEESIFFNPPFHVIL